MRPISCCLIRPLRQSREQLRGRARLGEPARAQLEVDRPAVVRIDQRQIPKLGALIAVGHARGGELEQGLGEAVDGADPRDLGLEGQQIGDEGAPAHGIEDPAHELGHALLVGRIGRGPARLLLRLAQRLDHVGDDPVGEVAAGQVVRRLHLERPGADQGLVEQVLVVPARDPPAADLLAARAVEQREAAHPPAPLRRQLA